MGAMTMTRAITVAHFLGIQQHQHQRQKTPHTTRTTIMHAIKYYRYQLPGRLHTGTRTLGVSLSFHHANKDLCSSLVDDSVV
jgi:hypothetical protein